MAVTAFVYGQFAKHLLAGDIDLDANTVKILLTTSTYTPDVDTHEFLTSVTNEVTGTGYTAGGKTLASLAVAYDSANNRATFDAADVTWTALTTTARRAVLYKSTGTAGTSVLIGWIDFGADASPVGIDFTIQFHATGILRAAV